MRKVLIIEVKPEKNVDNINSKLEMCVLVLNSGPEVVETYDGFGLKGISGRDSEILLIE